MSKYTPGPWTRSSHGLRILDKQGKAICRVNLTDNDEMLANAHLIAAAQDLLEALKEVLALTNMGSEQSATTRLTMINETARAAIAKAKGIS